jgi:hypothetical protein
MGLAAARLGDRLNLCLAIQPPALPDSEAHRLVALFLRNLEGLARDGNPTAG